MTTTTPTLPDTFAVFILTHGRPKSVYTLESLKNCGYTGKWFLICDDEDKSLDMYKTLYGEDKVIVFSKTEELPNCDRANNFGNTRIILMARNACFGIAERLGITHFLQLDDDYKEWFFRWISEGKLKGIRLNGIDHIIKMHLDFYEAANFTCLAFAQGGDFIGGIGNVTASETIMRRKVMNTFICSTKRPFRFIGALNEDVNTFVTLGSRGHLFGTSPLVSINQVPTQSQGGGMTEMYQTFGTYCKAFTTVMMAPSCVKVFMMSTTHARIHHRINWQLCAPCIVSERFRKPLAGESSGEVEERVQWQPPPPIPVSPRMEQEVIEEPEVIDEQVEEPVEDVSPVGHIEENIVYVEEPEPEPVPLGGLERVIHEEVSNIAIHCMHDWDGVGDEFVEGSPDTKRRIAAKAARLGIMAGLAMSKRLN